MCHHKKQQSNIRKERKKSLDITTRYYTAACVSILCAVRFQYVTSLDEMYDNASCISCAARNIKKWGTLYLLADSRRTELMKDSDERTDGKSDYLMNPLGQQSVHQIYLYIHGSSSGSSSRSSAPPNNHRLFFRPRLIETLEGR